MKLLGIIIIMNSLVVTGYWVIGTHQHKGWMILICFLAVFLGVFFTIHDRATEISFNKIGTIKTAAEQATADAKEITAIKERIESQSATVDLIAQKANTTVDQLHNIALTTAEATITDLMAANFIAGTTLKIRLDLHDRIIESLREIGLSEDKIKDVNQMWVKGIGLIYHRGIRYALINRIEQNKIDTKTKSELSKVSEEFQKMQDFKQWKVPSPDEMELFIEEKGLLNQKIKELIEDYRYFLQTGKIRRKEVFEKL